MQLVLLSRWISKKKVVPPVAGLFLAHLDFFAEVEHQVVAGLYRELNVNICLRTSTLFPNSMIAEAKLP